MKRFIVCQNEEHEIMKAINQARKMDGDVYYNIDEFSPKKMAEEIIYG